MDHQSPHGPQPQNFLPVLLGTVALGGGLLFLILISGGFFLYVLLAVFLIGAVGLFHYATWGQAFHEETEGEREEERLREETRADPW